MPFPFTLFGSSRASAGGASIPASITAGGNLAHWYKLDEGSTSAATDYGLNADSTDMTLGAGVDADETGPSAIGTPAAIKFDGSGVGSVFARSDGANTALGTLFDTNTWSVSWWMKDTEAGGYSNGGWHNWISCVRDDSWPWPGSWGVRYYYYYFQLWGHIGKAMHLGSAVFGSFGGSGAWRNYVITFNASTKEVEGWRDGTKEFAYDGDDYGESIDTSMLTHEANQYLAIGGVRRPGGEVEKQTKPYFSDLRFYDITLSDANIAAIYAGDWT